ncbi:hypothetical protein K7432_002529 [Basidiobolus ranarum]|uniref:Uncharacterized protein n=1 Tax=Basidiobolus ranarum TaxID=34480 RepID=A0ABR2W7R1_9FUNG
MFDTTRLLNYLSKPIELSHSLWPDLDRTLNEQRRNQSTSTSSHITDNENTLEFPISEPTTPTPNCTKPQDFSTSLGEVDTSLRSLSCHSPILSCNKEDVGQNGISPDIPSTLSNSQARLKFSSSTPQLRILNQNKDRSLLALTSNTTSSKSSCTSTNQSTEGEIAFGSFDGSKKYNSRSSFDETLYVRRRRMNQFDSNPTSQWNWNSEDTEEDFETDLISDDSPIATPAVSPSPSPSPTTSPQPQKHQFSKSESLPKKEALVEKGFHNDTEISSDPTKLKFNNSTPHVTGMVKVVGTTPPGNSDWSDELVGGLDFDSNDEWVNTFLSKNKCHQSSCSSFSSKSKTTCTNSTDFSISPVSLKHPKYTDHLYTKSEPRPYRATTPLKTMISSKTVDRSCINHLSLPKKKSNKQGIRESGRYDSQVFKNPRHSQRIPNPSTALSPSNNSQTRYTTDTRSDSWTTHTSKNHSPRTIGKVTMSNQLSGSTRHTLDYSIDLEDDTSFESAIQEPSKGRITQPHLNELTSPSRPSLIPYAFGEGKKAHIIGNMLFDPEKMCWRNLSEKGIDENERNSDPFENFSSDEEDIHSIQETQPPKEEFSVGTEFQLTAEELREMFKTEMEHKIHMQRWYVNSDLYTNHDRIGYKDPIIREVELLDIRLTWPDRFQSRSSR